MRFPATIISLLALLGCVPMPRIATAPAAEAVDIARISESHSRVLPLSRAAVFSRVLDLLLDQGFQVRSANETLGSWPSTSSGWTAARPRNPS